MIINCDGLTKKYGSFAAIDDITFQVEKPAIIGLIGRNGAGKTTLLKMIAGCWKHTTGTIRVFDHQPFNSLTVSNNSIFVDDHMAFPETLPLGEILRAGESFYPNWDAQLAERLFNYFQFDKAMYHSKLSKGKRSTFNMIIGMASQASLTIYDEPTTGMDRAVRQDFYRALLKDYINHPRTIIISSHHLEEVEDILEDLILMDEGKLLLHMPVDEVREYAIGVRGKREKVEEWARDKEVFHREAVGIGEQYVVVKNEYNRETITHLGFRISNISGADLAIYLTEKSRGGIDDVFNTES